MLLIAHCSLLSAKKVLRSEFRVQSSEFRVRVISLCQKKRRHRCVTSLTISVDKDLLSLLHLCKVLVESDDGFDSFEEVVNSVVFVR